MSEDPPADADAAAGRAGAEPEIWRLAHPDHGTLEVAVGDPDALRTLDEGYPCRKKDRAGAKGDATGDTAKDEDNDDDKPKNGAFATPGYVLLREGVVVARARQIGDHKVSITGEAPGRGKHTTALSAISGPRVQMRSNAVDTAVRQVTFRDGKDVVHFDPPPGSAAEERLNAIAASPWKRVAYPLAAGIGKSGWAIAMIILLPILGRVLTPVLDWIAERIPDIDIPWPDISLPSIPWPDISLPSLNLPSINLPEITMPGWVEFLLEYSKVWVPLLIGVAIAVIAVRHSRRSRRIKQQWQEEQRLEAGSKPEAEAPAEQQAEAPAEQQAEVWRVDGPPERRDERPDDA